MRSVRICPKCNYVEKYGLFYIILHSITGALMGIGVAAIAFLIYIGPTNIFDLIDNTEFNRFAREHTDGLRELALNYTTYDGCDSFEFAFDLVSNMPRIRYVLSSQYKSLYDPLTTLDVGGDCKNSAILFTGMLLSVGHTAYVDCSTEERHCVSYIPHINCGGNTTEQYMIVDLTSDSIVLYNESVDYWYHPEDYTKKITIIKRLGGETTWQELLQEGY